MEKTTKRNRQRRVALCAAVLLAFVPSLALAGSAEDGYIAGYATAVLEKEFHLIAGSVSVREGVVTVAVDNIAGAERDRMIAVLSRIRGVQGVEVVPKTQTNVPGVQPPGAVTAPLSAPASQWLPAGQLFDPLHADPRWPHFAATVRQYVNPGEGGVNTAFVGDFGESFTLYRDRAPFSGQWEVGVQAGVFSLFNLGGTSSALINADYLAGLLASYRSGDFSGFVRYLHQSSHLGDEFVLNTNVRRLNLSFEVLDAKLSYDLFDVLRLYGGAGALVRRDPDDLKVWRTEYGAELQSPKTLFGNIRPVAYADFQTNEQNEWSTNVSIRGGLQFENVRIRDRKLQFLVEYYSGYSPNGQFFLTTRIQTIGIGLHLYF